MAQFVGTLWCQGSLQGLLSCGFSRSKTNVLSSVTVAPFLPRTGWEDMFVPRCFADGTTESSRAGASFPAVVCYRDDDAPLPESLVEKNWSDMSARASLEIRFQK